MSQAVMKARSRLGVAVRLGRHDEAVEARRDLAAAVLEDHIKRTVDAAPPLTTEQRSRLALLLRGTAA
jgi:hypothetical protein